MDQFLREIFCNQQHPKFHFLFYLLFFMHNKDLSNYLSSNPGWFANDTFHSSETILNKDLSNIMALVY